MIPRKRIVRKTEPVKDPVRQANLFFDKQKEEKETPHTVMQGVLYDKIPGMFLNRTVTDNRYFFYKDHIYLKNEKLCTKNTWAGTSPDKSSKLVNVYVPVDECIRLSKYNPLVALYDFILSRTKYIGRDMEVSIILYKIENLLRIEIKEY